MSNESCPRPRLAAKALGARIRNPVRSSELAEAAYLFGGLFLHKGGKTLSGDFVMRAAGNDLSPSQYNDLRGFMLNTGLLCDMGRDFTAAANRNQIDRHFRVR